MTHGGYYLNAHRSQYAAGSSPITRTSGCTWTSVANGADAATGGKVNKTPDQVHALVKPEEETNRLTPGWSLADAHLALTRLGIPSEIRTGQGWAAVQAASASGHYVLVQGDSDRFGNETCSGTFDGDHCVGKHPFSHNTPEGIEDWIDDPICPTGRYETDATLRAYALKFNAGVSFLVLTNPVPRTLSAVIDKRTELYAYLSGGRFTAYGGVFSGTYVTKRVPGDMYRISIGGKTLYLSGANPHSITNPQPVPQLGITWHLSGG